MWPCAILGISLIEQKIPNGRRRNRDQTHGRISRHSANVIRWRRNDVHCVGLSAQQQIESRCGIGCSTEEHALDLRLAQKEVGNCGKLDELARHVAYPPIGATSNRMGRKCGTSQLYRRYGVKKVRRNGSYVKGCIVQLFGVRP